MLCSSLNLPTLAARRKQMKLCVMYRIVHGLVDFASPQSYTFWTTRTTRSRLPKAMWTNPACDIFRKCCVSTVAQKCCFFFHVYSTYTQKMFRPQKLHPIFHTFLVVWGLVHWSYSLLNIVSKYCCQQCHNHIFCFNSFIILATEWTLHSYKTSFLWNKHPWKYHYTKSEIQQIYIILRLLH